MRIGLALAILIGSTAAVLADGAPVLVIPGHRGVPVFINGVDASYAVVEGDWGLAKNTHETPVVYGGRYIDPEPNVGHYYPSSGHLPGYGRLEIEPPANRKLPQPAPSYHDSWSAQSTPQAPQPQVPFYPPPVIVAPQGDFGMPQNPAGPRPDFGRQNPGRLPR